jgi:hypothetical protein
MILKNSNSICNFVIVVIITFHKHISNIFQNFAPTLLEETQPLNGLKIHLKIWSQVEFFKHQVESIKPC